MCKPACWLTFLLLSLFLAACGVPAELATTPTVAPAPSPTPTSTPLPTPTPTLTPTPRPSPTPTPTQAKPTPIAQKGIRVEKVDDGFLVHDETYGYTFLLPDDDWIPFVPGQDDVDTIFAAAKNALPNVDASEVKRMMEQTGAEFRIFAFYTGRETRDENFAVNLNINTVPLNRAISIEMIHALNKKEITQYFPNATIQSEVITTNDQGVELSSLTIRNEIALGPEKFPLAQTFITFQMPNYTLVTITISSPWDDREALEPIIEQIMESITFDK